MRTQKVPGAIAINLGFDVEGEATFSDARTGEVVAETGPVSAAEFLEKYATAEDLEPIVAMCMEMALRAAAARGLTNGG